MERQVFMRFGEARKTMGENDVKVMANQVAGHRFATQVIPLARHFVLPSGF